MFLSLATSSGEEPGTGVFVLKSKAANLNPADSLQLSFKLRRRNNMDIAGFVRFERVNHEIGGAVGREFVP